MPVEPSALIRFHDAASAAEFLPHVRRAFRAAETPGAELLAVDWLGRQYLTVEPGPDPLVYRADLGYGDFAEVVERSLWERVLGESPEEVLDGDLYERFRLETGLLPDGLTPRECVEYTTPMYLGGQDVIANMAVIDLEVSWTLGSQILAQVRDLPPGTAIG